MRKAMVEKKRTGEICNLQIIFNYWTANRNISLLRSELTGPIRRKQKMLINMCPISLIIFHTGPAFMFIIDTKIFVLKKTWEISLTR